MPLNKESFRPSNRSESCPMLFRDVICSSSGEIKFVELEQRQRKIQPIPQELEDVRQESKEDVCDRDVLDDSYLMSCAHMDDLPKEETPSFVGDGWRAVTWSRLISSNCWQKGYVIDSDDMQSTYEVLTSTQRDKGVEMLRFRDLFSVFPTLSLNGAGDLLYLKSTVKFKDLNGWVSSIDIGKKTIKVLKPYCNGRHIPFVQMFRSCVLCHHLTVLPGPENIGRFIETSSNENHPKTIAAVKISHEMVSCTSWLAFCESCQTSSELEALETQLVTIWHKHVALKMIPVQLRTQPRENVATLSSHHETKEKVLSYSDASDVLRYAFTMTEAAIDHEYEELSLAVEHGMLLREECSIVFTFINRRPTLPPPRPLVITLVTRWLRTWAILPKPGLRDTIMMVSRLLD
uniref:DUF1618 domain-containing protein n=1 Tax=Oryza meridionalis TaxID=40149 RepID=A0A0E0CVX9_9ORYZ